MLTYTGQRNLFGTLTNNSSSTNLALGDILINNADADIINKKHWDFLETQRYASTVASQQFYSLPNSMDDGHLKSIYVTIATTSYDPNESPSRDHWNFLNSSNVVYSDIPEWYYVADDKIGFYPVPSSSGNTITIEYEIRRKNLSIADYTTGTIVSVANGGVAVVGNGTSWTSKMNGFWICITDSSSSNTGDGVWYQIDTVNSTTTLTLRKPYEGLSIAAGSAAYTIGQVGLLPEDFQILPVWMACQIYFTSIQSDQIQAKLYETLYNNGIHRLEESFSDRGTSPVIGITDDKTMINPNLTIQA